MFAFFGFNRNSQPKLDTQDIDTQDIHNEEMHPISDTTKNTPLLDDNSDSDSSESDFENETTECQSRSLSYNELQEEVKRLSNIVDELSDKVKNKVGTNEVILYFDGTIYVGSVTEDSQGFSIPHGYGTICYVYGSRYIGEWKDGYYHGRGTFYQDYYTRPFTSDWVNHIPHGKATWDGVHFVTVENGVFQFNV
jgi:hypothetical protein